ncbi:MAG: hypothetical protein ACUVQ1_00315 [Candidatus Kapaibacteriales bacterium]
MNKLKSKDLPCFYSAEDADSEKIEGKYYIFSYDELEEILHSDFSLFSEVFRITPNGNFQSHNIQDKGQNVLAMRDLPQVIAKEIGVDPETLNFMLENWRKRLLQKRNQKIPPAIDNKVLTDWNGLAIAGLSTAYRIIQNKSIEKFIYTYFDFFNSKLFDGERIFHTFIDGETDVYGMVNDYVYSAFGFFVASQVFLEKEFLNLSKKLLEIAYEKFWDGKKGGLFISSSETDDFAFNSKEIYDGVVPSGNSVAFYLSNIYSKLYGDMFHKSKSDELIKFFGTSIVENLLSATFFINSLLYYFSPTMELTIVCNPEVSLLSEKKFFNENFLPNVFINIIDNQNNSSYTMANGKTTYYLCKSLHCLPWTNDFEYICKQIKGEI